MTAFLKALLPYERHKSINVDRTSGEKMGVWVKEGRFQGVYKSLAFGLKGSKVLI